MTHPNPDRLMETLAGFGDEQQSVALSNMELVTIGTALDVFADMLTAKLRAPDVTAEEAQMAGSIYAEAARLNGRINRLVRSQIKDRLDSTTGDDTPVRRPDEHVGQYL